MMENMSGGESQAIAGRSANPRTPTQVEVITWARESGYPLETGAFGGNILIGPHFLSHLEGLAALAFSAGQAAERRRTVELCLSPIGRKLVSLSGGIEEPAAAIQMGESA